MHLGTLFHGHGWAYFWERHTAVAQRSLGALFSLFAVFSVAAAAPTPTVGALGGTWWLSVHPDNKCGCYISDMLRMAYIEQALENDLLG